MRFNLPCVIRFDNVGKYNLEISAIQNGPNLVCVIQLKDNVTLFQMLLNIFPITTYLAYEKGYLWEMHTKFTRFVFAFFKFLKNCLIKCFT